MIPDNDRRDRLALTWRDPPGWRGFLTTVDHKRIAARYIVTALLLLFLAGMLALRHALATIVGGEHADGAAAL